MRALRAHDATQQNDTVVDAVTAAAFTSASAGPNPSHRCGICGKAFERRDLRDRHKRRCAQTFTKPKRSKRRSCRACAVSKLGCDQEQPSCRRCLTRNISCEYVGDTADAEGANPPKTPGRVVADGNLKGIDTDTVTQILASLGDDTSLLDIDRHATHGAFPFPSDTPSAASGIGRLSYDAFGASAGGDADMDWSGNQLDRSDMDFALLWSSIGAHNEPPQAQGTPTAPSGARTADSAHNGDSSALGDNTMHPGRHGPRSPATGRDAVLSPEDMVNIILSYLPMMVSRDPPAPPFVHDQVYRCGDGDVKEPIARAMVCINAHVGAMPSGRRLVHEMINTERGRLIKLFQQCMSETDVLAVLHAMIVYQALGLFSDSAEQTRDGELHQPFLLKMTRKVAQKYRKDLIHDPTGPAPSSGWRQWCFTETLRRTIFLAHAINVLSARLHKQDPFFYEALDGDLVLDMPLPAPAALWEATSEAQWLSAQAGAPWVPRTGRMVLREKTAGTKDDDIFTRVIIATLDDDGLPDTRGL